jgi:hypothetical protein
MSSRLNADWDAVLVARPSIVTAGVGEVAAELAEALSSVGVVQG